MRGLILVTALLLYWSFSVTVDCGRFPYKELGSTTLRSSFPDKSDYISTAQANGARFLATNFTRDLSKNSNGSPLIFSPIVNGADPTGRFDSTAELQLTIDQAFGVASQNVLLKGIADLGGVEVYLEGGQYAISKPLTLPDQGGGNVLIHGGTLRAMSSFPIDSFLIEMGSSQLRDEWSKTGGKLSHSYGSPTYEDISFQNLMLDGNFSAGGILLLNPIRTTIADCYITHFSSTGISVHGGHETFIHNCFLGQHITIGGDPGERNFSGTAILLDSNDNAITDVVIFSAETGIDILGQANIINGVHCYNKATGWGGIGIRIRQGAGQNRLLGCYLDYTGIVLEETTQITISNSFFLGDAFILLKAVGTANVVGLSIVNNIFSGSHNEIPIVQTQGSFSYVKQTCVDNNSATGMSLRSTRAQVSVGGFGLKWTADLSDRLIFPNSIAHVQYSFFASNQNTTNSSTMFLNHALQSITATSMTVVSDRPVQAIVSFNVDQSSYSENEKLYLDS